MAIDFDKIFAENGDKTLPNDTNYKLGFAFLSGIAPTEQLFNSLFNLIDLKLQLLLVGSKIRKDGEAVLAGDIRQSADGLPSNLFLQCTTGGTTATTVPTWTGVGTSITDGTVTWQIVSFAYTSDRFSTSAGNPMTANTIQSIGAKFGNLYPLLTTVTGTANAFGNLVSIDATGITYTLVKLATTYLNRPVTIINPLHDFTLACNASDTMKKADGSSITSIVIPAGSCIQIVGTSATSWQFLSGGEITTIAPVALDDSTRVPSTSWIWDNISALISSSDNISVTNGTLASPDTTLHTSAFSINVTIPLPSGYTREQCKYHAHISSDSTFFNGGTASKSFRIDQTTGIITMGTTSLSNDARYAIYEVEYICIATK